MSNVIKFKKPRIIDYINGDDADYLEKRAGIAGQAFDDGKLIENLQNDANHEIYDALFMCVQATFQRASNLSACKGFQRARRTICQLNESTP